MGKEISLNNAQKYSILSRKILKYNLSPSGYTCGIIITVFTNIILNFAWRGTTKNQ